MKVLRNFFRAMPIGLDGQPYRRGFWRALGRLTIMVAGVCVLGGAAIIGATLGHEYWTYDLPKSKVAVSVRINDAHCKDPKTPVFVGVANKSNRRIKSYNIYPLARFPKRSTNLADNIEPFYNDWIIDPGDEVWFCYELQLKRYRANDVITHSAELVWGVESFSVRFDDR